MRRYTRLALAAAALVAAASLTACSSDSATSTPKAGSGGVAVSLSPSKSAGAKAPVADGKAELEKSVRAYTDGLFGGVGDGYDLMSKRCQAEMAEARFVAMSKQAHHEYGALKVKTLNVDQLAGDLARVSYGVGVPQFERKGQPWSREGGVWKWDACQASGE